MCQIFVSEMFKCVGVGGLRKCVNNVLGMKYEYENSSALGRSDYYLVK